MKTRPIEKNSALVVGFFWPLWAVASLLLGSLLAGLIIVQSRLFGGAMSISQLLLTGVAGYIIALVIAVGVPYVIKRNRTTRKELGLSRSMSWTDIGLSIAGFIVYLLLAMVIINLVSQLVPGFDAEQKQELGFSSVFGLDRIMAFVTLVVIAPVVEEVLFRGLLYGKLRQARMPLWLAITVTSLAFAVVHAQWNVGIDVFILSVVACILREMTGSIWASILLHMIKNALAFYLLFVLSIGSGL